MTPLTKGIIMLLAALIVAGIFLFFAFLVTRLGRATSNKKMPSPPMYVDSTNQN